MSLRLTWGNGSGSVIVLALVLAGCGGSGGSAHRSTSKPAAPKPAAAKPPCPAKARAAFAAFNRAGLGAVSVGVSRGPELVNCTFSVGSVTAKATLDSAPQAYFRLERTIVEDGQQFASQKEYTPPVNVNHLGVAASWFPDEDKVMTTDGITLITVAVRWPGARVARKRALAEAVARPLLGPLHPPQ